MEQVIIRHDDFDFRLMPNEYIAIHQKFIEADLIETAVLQFTQNGNLSVIDPTLIKHMKESSHWDFAIHGWAHTEYDFMDYNYIVRDLSACKYQCYAMFGKWPTVWHPPWNRMSIAMERAADYVGMKIDNESNDIAKFIREVKVELNRGGKWNGHSVYFHGWKSDELIQFPEMLQLVKTLKEVKQNEPSII